MISKIREAIHTQNPTLFGEFSTTNGKLLHSLLSPITENSTDILSTPIPINRLCSNTSQRNVLTNANLTIDELNHMLRQYIKSYDNAKIYIKQLDEHCKDLSNIIECLRNNENLKSIIEVLETRLLQINVKRNQIDHLLNQFSIKDLIEKLSPSIVKSTSIIDYNQLLTSIQLSMNQKTTLLDHLNNEYRYTKYHLNEYASTIQQRHQSIMKLIEKIEELLIHQSTITKETNYLSINNQHNRQYIELIHLSNEYEQLKKENHLLTLEAKEKLERFYVIMQSNRH